MLCRAVWVMLLLVLLPGVVCGQVDPASARAEISQDPVVPGGEATVVVELSVLSRYHAQSAFAEKPYIAAHLTVNKLPAGVQAGAIEAQVGVDMPVPPGAGEGTISVYSGKAYFLVPVKIAADAAAGPATIDMTMVSQSCDANLACFPPKQTPLKVTFTIGGGGVEPKASALQVLAKAKTFKPQPVEAVATNAATTTGSAAVPPGAPVVTGEGKLVPTMETPAQLFEIGARPYKTYNAAEHEHSLLELLVFALVGGLVLNVMPCVLPVIPLKVLSFVQQAHGDRRVALLHGVAFSAGVMSLFVALAVVLRVAGMFYGQQFQSTPFLVAMVMFVVALGLSMVGVWTMSPPRAVYAADEKFSHGGGLAGSFSSGLMATLLATPCSAPFLGPVLAWALVRPAWLTAGMLALVGLGMSLPYLVLAMFPQALAKVPRAGRWSELLKQGLGIVMLGVAVYLITLVPSTQLWPWVMAGTIVMAIVCWGWGQIPTALMSQGRIWGIRAGVVVVGGVLAVGIVWMALRLKPPAVVPQSGTVLLPDKATGDVWLPFNVALLDQALKDGRPVVVDWTADWCINCRVLEATVLSRDGTKTAEVGSNAVLLRADLSQENPAATALNEKLGGRAIPVLAIFSPGRPYEPVVLRDSYSEDRVAKELKAAQ